ncbi:CHAT domain-containing protein [Terrimonas sp. NA20]|uniref:CHAT domain-containing protein n=1 Tax=Terrimonas ginsenosidimutans TaxID=2908004 RepID=A0ABS9KK86_9BACT|nr:CHAT domain-containing protein [Terrimonas ginsenosidimutans]MCG2612724.1 CHAT domain-containing protein [Terrimonas ginsenosidimutans]
MHTQTDQTPIALLAFANPKDDLDRLIDEQRMIAKILNSKENEGLCAVVERPAADLDTILSVIQDGRFAHRIAIFHFGGHADDYSLLFRSGTINTKAFDKILAGISSLRLVFLNGCATRLQAENLHKLGVPAVIASIQAVPDKEASDFANVFYRGLAERQSVRDAFEFAKNSVKSARSDTDSSARGVGDENEPDGFSWELWAEDEKWTLRDEIDNPYFGLPKPVGYFLPKDPYISLKSYTENECAIFWGRGAEIRELYDRVLDERANPVTLLYGQTGVGKSSLLDAGLVPRLKVTTNVVYCKRISSEGLSATLLKELMLDDQSSSALADHVKKWSLRSGKKWTVIIIDQIEECFTKPLPQKPFELPDFIRQILELLQHSVRVKVLLAYRKEFHAEIENGVVAAKLPFSSYFLQALKRSNIKEIVNGSNLSVTSRNQYKIEIEQGLDEQIASDLSADVDSPVAPVLQILLSNLWVKTIPVENARVFTKETYYKLKQDGFALKDFFNRKVKEIEDIEKESVGSGLLLDLLHFHTTELGTSATHSIEETKNRYDAENIPLLIEKCKSSYLLVDATGANNDVSLAHDTLAPVIRSAFDSSLLPGQKATRILKSQLFTENTSHLLNERDLDLIKKGMKGTRKLDDREKMLVKASQIEVNGNRRRKKYQDILIRAAVVAVVIALGVSLYLYDRSKSEARKSRALYLSAEASKMLDSDPTQALHLLRAADSLQPDDDGILQNIYSVYNNISKKGVYYRDVYIDLKSPSIKFSTDKQLMLLSDDRGGSEYFTKACIVDQNAELLSVLQYKDMEIESIDFVPGKDKVVCLFNRGFNERPFDSIRSNVLVYFDRQGRILKETAYKYGIDALSLSHDGETMFTVEREVVQGSLQHFIVHREIASGNEVSRFKLTHRPYVLKSHPHRNIVLFNSSKGVNFLNFSTGKLTTKKSGPIDDAEFSPDGAFAASFTFESDKIQIWGIDDNSEKVLSPYYEIESIAFSTGSDKLLAMSANWVTVTRLSDGAKLADIRRDEDMRHAFLSDDNTIAVVNKFFGGFTLIDYAGNVISHLSSNNRIISAAFKNDSLVVTSSANSIQFWNIAERNKLPDGIWMAKNEHVFNIKESVLLFSEGLKSEVPKPSYYIQDIVPSSEGATVFSGNVKYTWMPEYPYSSKLSDTSVISVIKDGNIVSSVPMPDFAILSALPLKNKGEYLAICNDGKARVVNTKGKIIAELNSSNPYDGNLDGIQHAIVQKSMKRILTFTRLGYIIYWDMQYKRLETLDFTATKTKSPGGNFYPTKPGSLAISENEKLLSIFYRMPYTLMYNMMNKKMDTIFERRDGGVKEETLTGNLINNGKYLITRRKEAIDLWNITTKTKISSINCPLESYYLQGNEEALLINQYQQNAIRWLLPNGIRKWIKEVDIAPLSDQNKIKYSVS